MLVEAHADRLVGLQLGGTYRLVGLIGEGGMGAVYEAHHLRIRKRVAVKVMNQSMAGNVDAVARFHREAAVTSRLAHPNLVQVSDFGLTEQGQPYLVMEFLEGEDLERRLRRAGPVNLRSAVHLTRQVAAGLSVVHAKGIVHRDLKPANIFLTPVPGEPELVKVLDFGVSKIRAAHTKITVSRMPIGTPAYMSPEQAGGNSEEVDHRTDQWALACIVWEMLSGRVPFKADNLHALFFQMAHLDPPPLAKHVPDLPEGVEPVLLRALAKKPGDRYSSVREFARAFESAALGGWADLTPLPIAPAKLSAFIESLPPAGEDLVTPGPVFLSRFEAAHPRLRFLRTKLKTVVSLVSAVTVLAAAWVLITHAREGRPVAVTDRAMKANVPAVSARPEIPPPAIQALAPAVMVVTPPPRASQDAVRPHAESRPKPVARKGRKGAPGQWRIFEEL